MNAEELRNLQRPSSRSRAEPGAALVTLKAHGTLGTEHIHLQRRDRQGTGRGRPAPGDRGRRPGRMLRRHAASRRWWRVRA